MLPPDPVIDLYLEDVGGPVAEYCAVLCAKTESPAGIEAGAALRPYEEHRRPRTVLPSQYRVPDQRSEREIRIVECEWRGRSASIRVDGVFCARRRRRRSPRDRADVLPVNQLVVSTWRGKLAESRV